ncbi:hypothetical protein HK102_001165 [Quaeritorhiza haematococci]|nr:hypothetical protein HK102_001165 [Quaeritorhiza haematococci]
MSANDPGHIGNLTNEQLEVLRNFYTGLFSAMNHMDDVQPKDNSLASTSNPKMRALEEFALATGYDHPDAICLRFLRARKWDVEKAVTMFVKLLKWRQEYGVQQLLFNSEKMLNPEDLETGKGYFCGFDNEGRPVQYVQVRLHDKNKRDLPLLQNYVVWSMEAGRLLLKHPVEMATIVFDMGGFSLTKSMDYQVVQFLVNVLESYYPESLGGLYIVNAPFVFNGCWQVIRPWIDPVVASKIKFIKTAELKQYIPLQYIPKTLDPQGSQDYQYRPPTKDEQSKLAAYRSDPAAKKAAQDEFQRAYLAFADKTIAWSRAKSSGEFQELRKQRDETVREMQKAYAKLSPFVRSPTHYHRVGLVSDPGLDSVIRA